MGIIILSAIVAHTGWHWMLERGAVLGRFHWPTVSAALLAGALRWLIVILIVAAGLELTFRLLHGRRKRRPVEEDLGPRAESPLGI